MSTFTIKTFIGKVLDITIYNLSINFPNNLFCSDVDDDVIMGPVEIVKNVNENSVVGYETAGAERV